MKPPSVKTPNAAVETEQQRRDREDRNRQARADQARRDAQSNSKKGEPEQHAKSDDRTDASRDQQSR
jgi:hypothetical protein